MKPTVTVMVAVMVMALVVVALQATTRTEAAAAAMRKRTARPTPRRATMAPTQAAVDPTTACEADADCTFIQDPSCCPMCRRAAVNANMVQQFIDKHKCNQTDVVCPLACILDLRVAICEQKTCVLREPNQIACDGFIMNPHTCPAGYACYKAPGTYPDMPGRCMPQIPCLANNKCESPLNTCDASTKLCTFTNPGNANITALAKCSPEAPCSNPTSECVQDPAQYCVYGTDFDCKGVCVASNACDGVKCGPRRKCLVCPQPGNGNANPVARCVAKSSSSCPKP